MQLDVIISQLEEWAAALLVLVALAGHMLGPVPGAPRPVLALPVGVSGA